ncbi:type VI secretion system lipoprotein TssJ [Pseudomonas citronellolis]|jgi:type VI secretion system protein VasD|uniref:type VI secretion system lipoprotein TssJ n=1 Tax=Pseudomonas citronellolis TaxID=53408 RepID=UPI00226F93C8|nr:type VI secretion system lipoprotein TssJ [Pseudomonas citronellolis]WAB90560.1 type VI secretion system lipoprotein TssJ [Pseudomonas citronellolis]
MKRTLGVLLATLLIGGCSTVGNVFKKTGQILMDPSIQVGSAADQPTQIALSLYAGYDVNPNPESATPDMAPSEKAWPAPALAEDELDGPYAIRLNSASRVELLESLRALLDHLQETPSSPGVAIPGGKPKLQAPPATPRPAFPGLYLPEPFRLASDASLTSTRPTPPSPTQATSVASSTPLPVAAVQGQREVRGLAPGQYQAGATLPDAPVAPPASSGTATPIAFKVLQLKDDSMFLNADPEQLWHKTKKALGSTYLSVDDYILLPGQFKFINFRRIDEDANYIAVVADFRDPNIATWKQVLRVDPRGQKYNLLVSFLGNRVSITDERYPPAQPSQSSKQP